MTPDTFLRDASLLQLTQALVSKSHQVFVLRFLTTRTCVTLWRFFVSSGSSPTRRVTRSFEGYEFSYRRWHAPGVTTHWSTCTSPAIHHPLYVTLIRTTGTQIFSLVLQADAYPLDRDFQNLLNNQRKATRFASTARSACEGFQLVPIYRIGRGTRTGRVRRVHVDTAHVRLAHMEIDNPVVSLPLVGGVPQRRNLPGIHSDVIAEIRRASFGCDHPTGILQIRAEVQSILPRTGCFSTYVQDTKAPLLALPKRG